MSGYRRPRITGQKTIGVKNDAWAQVRNVTFRFDMTSHSNYHTSVVVDGVSDWIMRTECGPVVGEPAWFSSLYDRFGQLILFETDALQGLFGLLLLFLGFFAGFCRNTGRTATQIPPTGEGGFGW